MGKSLKQDLIRDDILLNFIEDTDDNLISNKKIIEELDLLVDNMKASAISGCDDTYGAIFGRQLKYVCKQMCHLNKDIKKYVFKNSGNKLFSNMAYIPKEYIDLSSYLLYPGIYYAEEKKNKFGKINYLVLQIDQSTDDSYMFNWTLYFVGKKSIERKGEFLDKMMKFIDDLPFSGIDRISYMDGRPSSEVIFKSFDQMVFTNKDNIIKYIDNWKKNIPEYNKYGMIPKLSILLYGEPGTGKSTFYKALAKHLDLHNVKSLSPQFFDIKTDTKAARFSSGLSAEECIYAIDDIDTVGISREEDKGRDNARSISTLLDFLDSPPTFYMKAHDGKYYLVSIVCATTNYFDKLDKAVKREGRFDLKLEMNRFTKDQAQEMCDIYNLRLEDIYEGEIKDDTTFSPAHIQALCTENIDSNLKGN